jgi:hypothetical protein
VAMEFRGGRCDGCLFRSVPGLILCVRPAGDGSGAVGQGGAGGEVQGAQGLGHLGATQRRGHDALVAGGPSGDAHGCRRRSARGTGRGGWGARAAAVTFR